MKNKIKPNKHKATKIVFPVIAGASIIGGVTAGVIIALNRNPVVSADETNLTINPVTKVATISININEDVKDDRTFAYIKNDESKAAANGTKSSAVIFNNTKATDGNFDVIRHKMTAKVAIDYLPTIKGTYTYHFDVGVIYNDLKNREIKHEVKNFTLTYQVDKSYVEITDPSTLLYKKTFDDEKGTCTIHIDPFKYHGSIDEANFGVKLISPAAQEAAIGIEPILTIDHDNDQFTVDLNISNGTDAHNLETTLEFYYNGEVTHTTRIVLDLIEKETLTEPIVTVDSHQMVIDKTVVPAQATAVFTFYGFKFTGLRDIENNLQVNFDHGIIEGVTFSTGTITNVVETPRNKTFDVQFTVTVTDKARFDEPFETQATLSYLYNGIPFYPTNTPRSFEMRLLEGNTISAPASSVVPEYVKFHKNEGGTISPVGNKFEIHGFKYSGFNGGDSLLNKTIKFKYSDGTNNYEVDAKISSIEGTTFTVTLDEKFGLQNPDGKVGRNGVTISGNFDFSVLGDNYYYYEEEQANQFKFKAYWEDNIYDTKPTSSITVDPTRFDANGNAELTFKGIKYTGLETADQQSYIDLDVSTSSLPGANITWDIDWNNETQDDPALEYTLDVRVHIKNYSGKTTGLIANFAFAFKNTTTKEQWETINHDATINGYETITDIEAAKKKVEINLDVSEPKTEIIQKFEGFAYTGFEGAEGSGTEKAKLIPVLGFTTKGVSAELYQGTDSQYLNGIEWNKDGDGNYDNTFNLYVKFTVASLEADASAIGSISFKHADTQSVLCSSTGYQINFKGIRKITPPAEKEQTAIMQVDHSADVVYSGFTYTAMPEDEILGLSVAATDWTVTCEEEPTPALVVENAVITNINTTNKTFDVKVHFKDGTWANDYSASGEFTFTSPTGQTWALTDTFSASISKFGIISDNGVEKTVNVKAAESSTTGTFKNFSYEGFASGYSVRDLEVSFVNAEETKLADAQVVDVDETTHKFNVSITDNTTHPWTNKSHVGRLVFKVNGVEIKTFSGFTLRINSSCTLVDPSGRQQSMLHQPAAKDIVFDGFKLVGVDDLTTGWGTVVTKTGSWADDSAITVASTIIVDEADKNSFGIKVSVASETTCDTYEGGFSITFTSPTSDQFTLTTKIDYEIAVQDPTPTHWFDEPDVSIVEKNFGGAQEIEFTGFQIYGINDLAKDKWTVSEITPVNWTSGTPIDTTKGLSINMPEKIADVGTNNTFSIVMPLNATTTANAYSGNFSIKFVNKTDSLNVLQYTTNVGTANVYTINITDPTPAYTFISPDIKEYSYAYKPDTGDDVKIGPFKLVGITDLDSNTWTTKSVEASGAWASNISNLNISDISCTDSMSEFYVTGKMKGNAGAEPKGGFNFTFQKSATGEHISTGTTTEYFSTKILYDLPTDVSLAVTGGTTIKKNGTATLTATLTGTEGCTDFTAYWEILNASGAYFEGHAPGERVTTNEQQPSLTLHAGNSISSPTVIVATENGIYDTVQFHVIQPTISGLAINGETDGPVSILASAGTASATAECDSYDSIHWEISSTDITSIAITNTGTISGFTSADVGKSFTVTASSTLDSTQTASITGLLVDAKVASWDIMTLNHSSIRTTQNEYLVDLIIDTGVQILTPANKEQKNYITAEPEDDASKEVISVEQSASDDYGFVIKPKKVGTARVKVTLLPAYGGASLSIPIKVSGG